MYGVGVWSGCVMWMWVCVVHGPNANLSLHLVFFNRIVRIIPPIPLHGPSKLWHLESLLKIQAG